MVVVVVELLRIRMNETGAAAVRQRHAVRDVVVMMVVEPVGLGGAAREARRRSNGGRE